MCAQLVPMCVLCNIRWLRACLERAKAGPIQGSLTSLRSMRELCRHIGEADEGIRSTGFAVELVGIVSILALMVTMSRS